MATSHAVLDKQAERNGVTNAFQRAARFLFGSGTPNRVTLTADVLASNATKVPLFVLDKGIYTGGAAALQGGKSYALKGVIYTNQGGDQQATNFDFDGSTCTIATGSIASFSFYTSIGVATTQVNDLTTDANFTDNCLLVSIDGHFVCSGSGSLALRMGAASSTDVTARIGSWMEVREVLS